MPPNDATVDIPLEQVVTHGSTTGLRHNPTGPHEQETFNEKTNEKTGLFHRGIRGRRKMKKLNSKGETIRDTDDEVKVTKMGQIYSAIMNFSVVTRYFIYILPLGLILAAPIIVGFLLTNTVFIGKVKLQYLFLWLEIVWLGLWASKIVAHFLPRIFQFLMGVVSAGTRKYALIIKALEIPLSLVGWAVTALATFRPIMTNKGVREDPGDTGLLPWMTTVNSLLFACVVSACVLTAEKLLVQLISINYHRKQFDTKIHDSKRNVHLLGLLYDASRDLFPAYCNEFAEEDYIINDSIQLGGNKKSHHTRSGSNTPLRLLRNVGRIGDKVTSAFGHVAHEVTGKRVFNPDSAHSVVVEALEKIASSEALARRLWMSFVVEGRSSLFQEDIAEVLGVGRQVESEEAFSALDRDGNGDISLDEMVLTVTEFGRERKAIATSMHDVDQAINVLDGLLSTIVFILCIFVFVAFLFRDFVATLATAGTALLSLSFVFAATAQEVLGSCIFLFVKHPFDIGDRVDLNSNADQLFVEHISLLFTEFRRVSTGKVLQIPNIVLNGVWIENVTRSKAMREQIPVFCSFDTSFEDITALKNELRTFLQDKENNRDFLPDIEIEVISVAEMNKLELRVDITHKSNWANETVRAARRSKFMCALVLALRKVPIYGPGGGSAVLGDSANPSYSVAISHEQAQHEKDRWVKEKEAKRLFPTKKPEEERRDETSPERYVDHLGPISEHKAIDSLNARPPVPDVARDQAWTSSRDDTSTLGGGRTSTERNDLDEVRGLLRRETQRGKRRQGQESSAPLAAGVMSLQESQGQRIPPSGYNSYDQLPAQDPSSPLSPQQSQPASTYTQIPISPPTQGFDQQTRPMPPPQQQYQQYPQPQGNAFGQAPQQEPARRPPQSHSEQNPYLHRPSEDSNTNWRPYGGT